MKVHMKVYRWSVRYRRVRDDGYEMPLTWFWREGQMYDVMSQQMQHDMRHVACHSNMCQVMLLCHVTANARSDVWCIRNTSLSFTWMTNVSCYVTVTQHISRLLHTQCLTLFHSTLYIYSHLTLYECIESDTRWMTDTRVSSDSLYIHIPHSLYIHIPHSLVAVIHDFPHLTLYIYTFTRIMWTPSDYEVCRYRESDEREWGIAYVRDMRSVVSRWHNMIHLSFMWKRGRCCVWNRHQIWWMWYTCLRCRYRELDEREGGDAYVPDIIKERGRLHCNTYTLQHTAAHARCNTLQHNTSKREVDYSATHARCNTLQHIHAATHCNTLHQRER